MQLITLGKKKEKGDLITIYKLINQLASVENRPTINNGRRNQV